VYGIIYIYNLKSENIDFKGLAEVINKLIFNNPHNPPPTKYFDTIINPLYSTAQNGVGGRLWRYICI
jgi:hypothetical protein